MKIYQLFCTNKYDFSRLLAQKKKRFSNRLQWELLSKRSPAITVTKQDTKRFGMQLRELKTYINNRKRFLDTDFFEKFKIDAIGRLGNVSALFARTRVTQLVDYRDFPFSVSRTHHVLGSAVAVAVGTTPR